MAKNRGHIIICLISISLLSSCRKDLIEKGTIADIDGNVYQTVRIGDQWWMAENLRTTKFSNGDMIGTTNPATLDINSIVSPKLQWTYEGNESYAADYGRLYTWFAVADNRKICPAGWHIPTDTEWSVLVTFLGGENNAGDKLKESGFNHWNSPNSNATNITFFSALPGGYRDCEYSNF